jgi:CBS domain-containing membrane protein
LRKRERVLPLLANRAARGLRPTGEIAPREEYEGRIRMITVDDIMTTELHTLLDSDCIFEARRLMTEQRIRHVPVVNEAGQFVGLLTQRDLLASTVSILADVTDQELAALESSIPINEVMTTDTVVAEQGTTLIEAARHLLQYKHGCLPVVSNGILRGIITEADFVELAVHLLERLQRREP